VRRTLLPLSLILPMAFAEPATAADRPAAPEVVIRDPSFNWNRFYVGAFAGAWLDYPAITFDTARAGGVLGRNVTIGDRFMIGAELAAGVYTGPAYPDPVFETYATIRGGLRFDKAFLYGSAALGYDTVFGTSNTLGGGVEFAINSMMTVRADAQLWAGTAAPFDYLSVTGGVSWYIRR